VAHGAPWQIGPLPEIVHQRMAAKPTPPTPVDKAVDDDPFGAPARTFTRAQADAFVEPYRLALEAAERGQVNGRLNDCAVVLGHFTDVYWSEAEATELLLKWQLKPWHDADDTAARKTIRSGLAAGSASWKAEAPEPEVTPEPEGEEPADDGNEGFFTDAILAETFRERELRGRWAWTAAAGWYRWDGKVWRETSDPAAVEAARAWFTLQFRNRARRSTGVQADIDALVNWKKCLSKSRIEAVLSLCKGLCEVPLETFDRHPLLLNTPGGVLDLQTGDVLPHHPKYAMTRITKAGPGDDGRADWEKFLDRVLPDATVRGYVQRLLGHSLLGEVRDHLLPMLHGSGRNGKGTLRDAVLHAVGDYGLEVDPGLLMKRGHDRHLTFMMELRGRRVVFTSETQRDQHLDEPAAKRLVGGDPIQANRMRRDPVTFIPSHTLLLMTNYLPVISGDDSAMAARVKVVPFEVEIPEIERDVRLSSKLRDAAPAVMAWLVDGLRGYLESGLSEPERVRERSREYVTDSDPLARFLAERTEPAAGVKTPARVLYQAYHQWMTDLGYRRPVSEKAFSDALNLLGFDKARSNAGMVWMDLHLKADTSCTCPNGAHGVHRDDCI
jgi:putative DNA primase/helicase